MKESCRSSSDKQFSFKYFLYIAFVREISSKLSDRFGCYLGLRSKEALIGSEVGVKE